MIKEIIKINSFVPKYIVKFSSTDEFAVCTVGDILNQDTMRKLIFNIESILMVKVPEKLYVENINRLFDEVKTLEV